MEKYSKLSQITVPNKTELLPSITGLCAGVLRLDDRVEEHHPEGGARVRGDGQPRHRHHLQRRRQLRDGARLPHHRPLGHRRRLPPLRLHVLPRPGNQQVRIFAIIDQKTVTSVQ